jgi:hypothetical protein
LQPGGAADNKLLNDLPIYEALLERDLVIEQGAPFAGQEAHMLGLPPGCVLVR